MNISISAQATYGAQQKTKTPANAAETVNQ